MLPLLVKEVLLTLCNLSLVMGLNTVLESMVPTTVLTSHIGGTKRSPKLVSHRDVPLIGSAKTMV